jgi:hypothetical protein
MNEVELDELCEITNNIGEDLKCALVCVGLKLRSGVLMSMHQTFRRKCRRFSYTDTNNNDKWFNISQDNQSYRILHLSEDNYIVANMTFKERHVLGMMFELRCEDHREKLRP